MKIHSFFVNVVLAFQAAVLCSAGIERGTIDLTFYDGLASVNAAFSSGFVSREDVHVQATYGHYVLSTSPHDGVVSPYIEDVTTSGAHICFREVYNENYDDSHWDTRINYIAFQDCAAYPTTGITDLPINNNGETCETIEFTSTFDSVPRIQTTLTSSGGSSECEDSMFSWVEDISTSQFTACYYIDTGHYADQIREDPLQVDWMAYEESWIPDFADDGGSENIGYFTGDTGDTGEEFCLTIEFNVSFDDPPVVIATQNHRDYTSTHDPTTIYIDYTSTSDFIICLMEPANYDQQHWDIGFDWLAFSSQ